jgi:hypothetical protein
MSASSLAPVAPPEPEPGPPPEPMLEWRVNPWRGNPAGGVLVIVLQVVLVLLLWHPGEPLLPVAAVLVAFDLAMVDAVVVGRYRVDAAGVARRTLVGWHGLPWSGIHRARVAQRGLFVTPLATPGWRDAFRGLWLPVPGNHPERDTLLAELRRRLASHGL